LKDDAIDYLVRDYDDSQLVFTPNEIMLAFGNTSQNSNLRRMLLYFLVLFLDSKRGESNHHWSIEGSGETVERVIQECPDFYHDLALLQLHGRHENWFHNCNFHEHADQENDLRCDSGYNREWPNGQGRW
jgi:hypothetical protein